MSLTSTQPTSKLNLIAAHILQVIHQLSLATDSELDSHNQLDNQDKLDSPHQLDSNDEGKYTASILLVSEDRINDELSQLLLQNNPKLMIDCVTLAEFQNAPFNRRYTLGCLIQPFDFTSVSISQESQAQPINASYSSIAIRLRDLFAEQSLLLTYTPSSELNFASLGYIPLTIETPDEMPDLISWQFNLYDYKQRPDWLNAKYWANPENFDKYRW